MEKLKTAIDDLRKWKAAHDRVVQENINLRGENRILRETRYRIKPLTWIGDSGIRFKSDAHFMHFTIYECVDKTWRVTYFVNENWLGKIDGATTLNEAKRVAERYWRENILEVLDQNDIFDTNNRHARV